MTTTMTVRRDMTARCAVDIITASRRQPITAPTITGAGDRTEKTKKQKTK